MSEKGEPKRTIHPLLLYRRLAAYYRTPSIWLFLVSAGLLVWDHPSLTELRLPLVMTSLLAAILILITFVMSRAAHVQCGEDGLMVRLPLNRVHIPYEVITHTRTAALGTLFPPSKQPFSSRNFLIPISQLAAVVVEVELLPLPRDQLLLWMDSRMILKSAIVLLVEDHRALRNQIEEAMIHWRLGQRE